MRIAALDDDPILLELIKATTEQHGHVCHTYLTGTQLLRDIRLPERWAQAMARVPACAADRTDLQGLAWPARLAALPVWQQLGLTEQRP